MVEDVCMKSAILFLISCPFLCAGSGHCTAQNVSVTWQRQQLGVAFQRLAEVGSLPLWIDRRVDPTQLVDVKFSDLAVSDAITSLAAKYGLGTLDLGDQIYVGPRKTARGLASLILLARTSASRSAPNYRSKWMKPRDVSWPRFTEPRRLLEVTLSGVGITCHGLERVPHDLWPAKKFPQLSLVDQATLVLAGFDLALEITEGGSSCRIVSVKYPLLDRSRELEGKKVASQKDKEKRSAVKQFSLKLTNQPVGQVIEQLGNQLDLIVVWDAHSLAKTKRSKETLVSCDVKNVDLQGLLKAILEPAGMSFSIDEKALTISGYE